MLFNLCVYSFVCFSCPFCITLFGTWKAAILFFLFVMAIGNVFGLNITTTATFMAKSYDHL